MSISDYYFTELHMQNMHYKTQQIVLWEHRLPKHKQAPLIKGETVVGQMSFLCNTCPCKQTKQTSYKNTAELGVLRKERREIEYSWEMLTEIHTVIVC